MLVKLSQKSLSPFATEAEEDENEGSEKAAKTGAEHNHGDEIFLLLLLTSS